MIKIKLRLSSWIAAKLEAGHSGWFTLDKEIGEGSTISDLLADIINTYPGLREAIYNPEKGEMNELVNVALNDSFLNPKEISRVKLRDSDTVLLVPSIWGG